MHLQFLTTALALAWTLAGLVDGYVDSSGFESLAGVKNSYRLHQERVTWEVANRTCNLEGGHLIVLDDVDEAAVSTLLFGRLAAFSPPMAWNYDLLHVGITDKATEGTWLTVLGNSVSSGYNVWRKGEPNNYENIEHCGAIDRAGEYSDLRCSELSSLCPFICEKITEDEFEIDIRNKGAETSK